MASGLIWAFLGIVPIATAQLDVSNNDAILKSAKAVAGDTVALYGGNKNGGTPGRLDDKQYRYWEGGALMSSLIDYWHLTGDSTYNDLAEEALNRQVSEDTFTPKDLMPSYLGNDDQCYWALTAMQAAENKFPDSSKDQEQWAAMAQSVFDMQQARLDKEDKFCKGGLRWAISASHHGWTSKNSQANGCFFTLAARLARYTRNSTYSDAAEKMWDWMTDIGLIDQNRWKVSVGALTNNECASPSKLYYSIDATQLAVGAAFMYNHTNGAKEWRSRVEQLTGAVLRDFFPSNLAFEPDCETHELCNSDRLAYKGVNIRWMAVATQLAPVISDSVLKALGDTAKAMALGCKNGESGRKCQFSWLDLDPTLIFDEEDPITDGLGEEMNALSAISNLLIKDAVAPAVAPEKKKDEDKSDNEEGVKRGSDESKKDGDNSSSETSPGSAMESTKDGLGSKTSGTSLSMIISFGLLASGLTGWL